MSLWLSALGQLERQTPPLQDILLLLSMGRLDYRVKRARERWAQHDTERRLGCIMSSRRQTSASESTYQ